MSEPSGTRLLVFGAGGSGREVAWLAKEARPDAEVSFGVDREEFVVAEVDGIPVTLIGDGEEPTGGEFVAALGDPEERRHAVTVCERAGFVPTTLVHPGIDLTGRVAIGEGSILCRGVIVTTGITIGRHVHINLATTVSHDVEIGDFTTLAPGVNVSGHVTIGAGVYVGAGATIINGTASVPLIIGDGAVIAAGACVTQPVDPAAMVAGVPAIRKR